jgi:CRISPR-associated endonuclease/helicase Cas3
VIEHHSAVPVPEDGEGGRRSDAEIAAENWDAPVIVTTSVQFVESLFARATSQCRKVHNIARSVVILDEVQTLPVGLLSPILSVFRELTRNYGVSFVFSTATQPAFRQSASLPEGFAPGEVIEIAGESPTEVREAFQRLDRVRYERADGLDWKTLAERIAAAPQALCVVNLRKHAFALWEALRDAVPRADRDAVLHLSSAMCAQHRIDVLGELKTPREGSVRQRLKAGLPCWLVSTQVVEAGVDVDFPVVFRALGPLDSIVQAAGRCNREGRLPVPGRVVIFTPTEPAVPPGIYKTATGHTESLLARIPLESLQSDPELFGNYFSGLFQLTDTDHARRRESTIQEDREQLRFKEVARKAKVIEDDGRPVVVPFGRGREKIQSICARRPRFDRHDLRSLQRYMVNVRERDLQRLAAAGAIRPLLPNLEVFVLDDACYHRSLGVLVGQHPTEDLCGV